MSASAPLLRMHAIEKSFPGVHVLRGVGLTIECGEVHALLGENGAGKSTLMHILAGVHQPDAGTIEMHGDPLTITNERQAQRLGIGIVYQERSLFSDLTVAENICANDLPIRRWGLIDRASLRHRSRQMLERLGQNIDPSTPLKRLSPAQQQMVEIAKALALDAKILILDEPTSALTEPESAALFRVVRQLQQSGVGIIYISHRMEEIFMLAQRVTVLRDGVCQGTYDIGNVTPDMLVHQMVGRTLLEQNFSESPLPSNSRTVLEVEDLSESSHSGKDSGVRLQDISFHLREKEVLGFAGLAGAGRTELALSLFGARPFRTGSIRLNGQHIRPHPPREAMTAGLGYVPEDRKELGLFLDMSLADNIAAAHLGYFGQWKLSNRKRDQVAQDFIQKLHISTRSSSTPVNKLSGGNQQKAVLARWLLRQPKVLIIDEPTRGIDVAAKAEVHALIHQLARQGTAVIIISSDLPEVLALSDRVIVMRAGKIAGELSRENATEEGIMHLAAMDPGISA